jgi:hypothetical protein
MFLSHLHFSFSFAQISKYEVTGLAERAAFFPPAERQLVVGRLNIRVTGQFVSDRVDDFAAVPQVPNSAVMMPFVVVLAVQGQLIVTHATEHGGDIGELHAGLPWPDWQ